jgi:hypothetical protein
MATTTTYSLIKPTVGGDENTWGADLNTNFDSIDDLLDGTTAIAPNLTAGSWEVGGVAVTATAAELNILDGVTATTAELNIMDGVTATAAELNILDGVTATAAELNVLDGITASTGELNAITGVTATGTALIRTASASAARTTLGATTLGADLFTSVSAQAARNSIVSPTRPEFAVGVGQWRAIVAGAGAALVLPADGTWAYHFMSFDGAGNVVTTAASVAAGGSTISGTNDVKYGFAWRING